MTSLIDSSRLDHDQIQWVVEQATRAPSIHNTQPWRFICNGAAIDLHADLRRGLAVSDPNGRELVMSCGAALYNLRLALRQIGRSSTTSVLPDPAQPRLLARVTVDAGPAASARERALFSAISRRHTHRGAFDEPRIQPDLAVRLQQAALSQGAELVFIHNPGSQQQVLKLARIAERLRREDPQATAETEAWTPPRGSVRRDGVPAHSYSSDGSASGPEELAERDFDLGRGQGGDEPAAQLGGGVASLVTDGDLLPDWLRAGEALEVVLLTAALESSYAVLHSRVTEVPGLRAELRRELSTAGYPQLLMRFGYADSATTTPRRPATDVIDVTD